MKRTLLSVVIVVAGMGLAAGAETGKPRIQFDRLVYDFGTTSDVQQVAGTFIFQNTGDAELKVQKPVAACGCTVVAAKPDTLKPGEKGELQFTLSVGSYKGHVEKTITVPSNDPASPSVVLTLKVDMKAVYTIEPERWVLGDIRQGTVTNLPVVVRRVDGKPLVISKVESSSAALTAQIEEANRPDPTSARVLLQFNAETPRRLTDTVRIIGEEPGKIIGVLYVFGRVLGDISLNPESLFWGVSRQQWSPTLPDQMTTRRVRITSNQTQLPLEVRNAASSIKELKLDVQTIEAGKVFDVVARLTALPDQSARGNITFDTNLPGQPTVIVPVNINVLVR